jgi:hypothetical protein
LTILEVMLEIPAQSAAAVQPGYCAFHNPPSREDHEALLVRRVLHNAEGDAELGRGPLHQLTHLALVSPAECYAWAQVVRLGQYLFCTITVLDIGGMNLYNEHIPFSVHDEVALAALHLFAAIEAPFTAGFGGRPEGTRRSGCQ